MEFIRVFAFLNSIFRDIEEYILQKIVNTCICFDDAGMIQPRYRPLRGLIGTRILCSTKMPPAARDKMK